MPRFAGVPVDDAATPPAAPAARPRFAGVPADDAPRVTDLEPVYARPTPQDDPNLTFPAQPGNGADLLAWARWRRPELAQVPDQQLAATIRREVYPEMDPVAFYRDTGLGKQFGLDTEAPDPTAGMSGVQKFRAGAGSTVESTPRGIYQAGVESVARGGFQLARGLEGVGLESAGQFVDTLNTPALREAARLRQAETERKALDAPLMATGAGFAGNVVGNVVQTVGPGGALKLGAKVPQLVRAAPALGAAGSALLPSTVKGSAAAGAGFGAVQPLGLNDSQLVNTGAGLVGGTVGAGAPALVRKGGNIVANLLPNVSKRSQERAAADVLESFADDPAAVRRLLASGADPRIVAGTSPTLAEATGDIGLGGLQRTLANQREFGNALALQNEGNNRARVAAIETAFGGANASRAAALTEARDLAARQALRPIDSTGIGTIDPLRQAVTRIAIKNQSSQPVREAMAAIDAELPFIKTVRDAHNLRQYIGLLMSGQVEGKAGGKFAQSQLATVRNVLDRQMRQAFPEWGDFLRNYKAASREIGQVNVGEALLDKGPNVRAIGDVPTLSPAKFAGAVDDLDRTVQTATGFKRARADKALTPEQINAADEVRRDLERFARTQDRGRAVGSNTVQNALGGNAVQDAVGPVGAAIIEPVSGVALLGLNAMRKAYGAKVAGIVEEAMLDPQRAAEILARLPPKSRPMIVRQFAQLVQQSGSAGGRALAPPAVAAQE